jgi:hypothetical protein
MPPPTADRKLRLTRCDSCHDGTIVHIQCQDRRSRNDVNRQPTPHPYREDTSRKDQGRALSDEGSIPLMPNQHGPAIIDAPAPVASEGGGTDKTPVTELFLSLPVQTLMQVRVYQREADCGSEIDDFPVSVRGCFIWRTPMEIPACRLKRLPSRGDEERKLFPLLISTLLLLIISRGRRLGGNFLPPCPHSHLGSTPKPSPLPPRLPPFVVGMVGHPPRHILRQGDLLWVATQTPKTLHKNTQALKKVEIDMIRWE